MDNTTLNSGSGGDPLVTREITHSGDSAKLGGSFLVGITGSEGSYTWGAINGDAANGLDVDVTRVSGTVTVDGSGVTQPVSGTFWQATQPVSLASVPSHAVTGPLTDAELRATAVPVSGTFWQATQPVSGTVAISGTVTVGSHAVTNAGTFAVQVDGAGLTALQSIDGKITACNTGAVVISSGTITAVTSITNALPAGTNAIGKLAANAGVTIGAVEIAAAQTLAAVTTVTTVTTCATVSTLTGSNLAHGSVDSGNPHKIGVKASASLNGGTNVSGGQRTDLRGSVDGALYVRGIPLEDIVTATPVAITDGSSTSVIAAQGASVKIYVTEVIIANSSASNVTVDLRDGTAGAVKATFPVPAGGGVVKTLHTPLGFSANTAVAADPSAAASTITVTLIGFVSKI